MSDNPKNRELWKFTNCWGIDGSPWTSKASTMSSAKKTWGTPQNSVETLKKNCEVDPRFFRQTILRILRINRII